MKFKVLVFIILLFQMMSCSKVSRKVTPAFYHWQTNLSLTSTEVAYLDSLNVQKLYVKFFDVDWSAESQNAVPLALLEVSRPERLKNVAIIPTVFITNRTLKNLADDQLPILAKNIYIKITELARALPHSSFDEVQFDCDWSASTKAKYFELLTLLDQHFEEENPNIQLSATIRLHQIKYSKDTGIPPVDKGMLMCYNTGDLEDWETENSILETTIAKQYLGNQKDYPLSLDIALPIFSWGVLYRNDKMIKLLNNLRAEALETDDRFLKISENKFEVQKSTYLDGHYLYAEDLIRTEKIELEVLKKSAQLLRNNIENSELSVAFYHLDTTTIKHYPYAQLETIYHSFR